jgi:hypothetical protein
MFRLVLSCIQDDEQRRMLADPGFEHMRAHGMLEASEERKRQAELELAAMKSRLARHRSECDAVRDHMFDGSAYPLMLAAADQGDREAARCYVSAQLPLSRERAKDPQSFEDYRRNALRLIDAGMASGDWWMLGAAIAASNPGPDLQAWTWRPYEGPRYGWLMRLREHDPRAGSLRQYALTVLQSLGARSPGDAEGTQRTLALLRGGLPEADARRAEEWAVTQFRTAFHGRGPEAEPPSLCTEY